MFSSKEKPPDRFIPSILAGVLGLYFFVREPARAWEREKGQWSNLLAWYRLRKLGIVRHFERYPANAIPRQYDDLLAIYRTIERRKPKSVLELGGGYSTYVIAQAAKDLSASGHACEFHSVDESEHWQSIQKQHLPAELARFVTFHHSEPHLIDCCGIQVSAFRELPSTRPELIYVDGGLVPGNHIGGDVVLLEPELGGNCAIIVDGRRQTVEFLRTHLSRRYHVKTLASSSQTIFEPA